MKPPQKIEDSWLVTRYREGHKTAMALLVKRWHLAFCKQAFVYCKDPAIAKDIAQDAWITILSKLDRLEQPEKFGSWGRSIVTKKSIDWYRKRARNLEHTKNLHETGLTSDLEDVDGKYSLEGIGKMKAAIALLSKEHQQVLQLFYVQSYGLIEISEILQISKGTVKSRLYYAREHLKTTLKK